ncbi:MAG: GreA/GreB family elongation factor [Verrucomicrobiales bacterium]|nr:GreA/GreB family elongation factor [Verrucomicrobiales bacterium]
MSKAFTRESDDAPESSVLIRPASVLPPGTKNYMTAGGIQRLREEFQRITDVLARTPAASGTRSVLEGRCQQLQHTLETAVVVPASSRDQRVRFGATVSVRSRGGEASEYRIVGVDETEVDRDWVSWLSPIAKALTGRAVGERVRIRLPAGETELEITGIRYEE